MKINRLFLYAAALVMAVSCGKETPETPKTPADGSNDEEIVVPPAPDYAVSFTAYTETPPAAEPQAKATIGLNTNTKTQTFWEDGDQISVYSSNQTTSSKVGFQFSTVLDANSTSAIFGYDGEDFVGGNYIAIYPHKETGRAVNFSAQPYGTGDDLPYEGDAYRMANVDVPSLQTMVAGGFDRSSMIMVAYTENPAELHFKNAVALVKFKVSDEVSSGRILTPKALISGKFRADITASDQIPRLVDYEQSTYGYVDFIAPQGQMLEPDTEYYVVVSPAELSEGFEVYLNGKSVKSFTAEQVPAFERNKIYDLGTLTVPVSTAETKTLTFDFSIADSMTGWHTLKAPENAATTDLLRVPYVIGNVSYEFICANPSEANSTSFPYYTGSAVFVNKYRFLGLPAIEDFSLSAVTITNGSSAANSSRAIGVTSCLAKQDGTGENGQNFVAGGETKPFTGAKGTSVTFNLSRTEAGTVYYIRNATIDTAISSITLTYTQITE